jgi:hypothetical protein
MRMGHLRVETLKDEEALLDGRHRLGAIDLGPDRAEPAGAEAL